jgi:hypothetical protein
VIVSTERLGHPGNDASWLERRGIVQKQLVYPDDAASPTATCHLQPSTNEPALCGYPWEALVPVPGAPAFDSLPEGLRCVECVRRRA